MKKIEILIDKYKYQNKSIINRRPDLGINGDFTPDGIKLFCNNGFIEDLEAIKEISSKELKKIEIVFDDSLKAEIETTDKNIKVLRAVNGWGYSVNKEKIHINESKQ